jgi:excisionase family DNA binding protein
MDTDALVPAMDTVDLPEIMSRKQLAAYLGMTEPALSQMASRGQGPRFIRFGRSVRYRREDVLAWLESRVVDPTQLQPTKKATAKKSTRTTTSPRRARAKK